MKLEVITETDKECYIYDETAITFLATLFKGSIIIFKKTNGGRKLVLLDCYLFKESSPGLEL